jgi:transcriptional regulator with XRE-family HTH domain
MLRHELGARIRAARIARALAQRELAELAGVSHQLVSQIEKGTVNTTVDTLEVVARALGLDIEVEETAESAGPTEMPEVTIAPSARRAVADRFLAVLPDLPGDELDVFVHELALWERRYSTRDRG